MNIFLTPTPKLVSYDKRKETGTVLSFEYICQDYLLGAALVAQRFSTACSPGRDPGDPGSSPASALSMEPASPSACVSASLSVSIMNKSIKSFKKRERERSNYFPKSSPRFHVAT